MLPLPDLRLPMMILKSLPRPPRMMPRPHRVAGLILTVAVIQGAMLATGAAIGAAAAIGGKMAYDRMSGRRHEDESGPVSEAVSPDVSAEIERDLSENTGL